MVIAPTDLNKFEEVYKLQIVLYCQCDEPRYIMRIPTYCLIYGILVVYRPLKPSCSNNLKMMSDL